MTIPAKERYVKVLASLENFYESRANEPGTFLDQEISFIRKDLELDFDLSIGNISDSLGRISVHHAVSGVAAMLKNDKGGWQDIHKAMLYSFWYIRLKAACLKMLLKRQQQGLTDMRSAFSESAGLLLYCIYQNHAGMARVVADVLREMLTNHLYLGRTITQKSIYEKFALNLYAKCFQDERAYIESSPYRIYSRLHERLFTGDFNEGDVSALCDFHCENIEDTGERRPEFGTPPFDIIPIEILLIYKLRSQAGLNNPKPDHPLLNPKFMDMPVMSFDNDPLIDAVEVKYHVEMS